MLSGYRTAQRVCGLCMATHAAASGKRGSGSSAGGHAAGGGGPPSLHPSDACGPSPQGVGGTASEAAACTAEQRHLVGQLLTASARVRRAFPTGALGERTRCVLNNGSTFAEGLGRGAPDWILGVEFDADEVWVRSMGLLLDVGRLAADRNLKELRKPLAEGALARGVSGAEVPGEEEEDGASSCEAEEEEDAAPAAAAAAASGSRRRGIRCAAVSSSVNGVLQETVGVSVAGGGGAVAGWFVGTMCLQTRGNEGQKTSLLSACVTSVYAGGGGGGGEDAAPSSRSSRPSYVLGRSGRIDTSRKARHLARLVAAAVGPLRGDGDRGRDGDEGEEEVLRPPEEASCAPVPRRTRVQFCALLNALSVTQKELGFFRNQVAQMDGSAAVAAAALVAATATPVATTPAAPATVLSADLSTNTLLATGAGGALLHAAASGGGGSSSATLPSADDTPLPAPRLRSRPIPLDACGSGPPDAAGAGAAATAQSSPRERTRDLTHGAESAPVEAGSPRSPDQVILEVQPEDLRLVQTRSRQGRSIMEQGAAEVDSMRARRGTTLLHSFSAGGDGDVSLLVGSHGDDVDGGGGNGGVGATGGGVSDSYSTPSLSPPTTPARGAAAAAAAAAAPEAAATLHGGAGGDDGMRLTLSDNTSFLRASLQQLREIAGRTEDLEVEEEEAAVAAAEEASLQRQRSRQPSAAVPQVVAAAAAAVAAAEEEDLEETLFLEAAESTAAEAEVETIDLANVASLGVDGRRVDDDLLAAESVSDEDSDDDVCFDFPSEMRSLRIDYSFLNYVANWPLSLRMGVSQQQIYHNVHHPLGYSKYIEWLSVDVWNELSVSGRREILRRQPQAQPRSGGTASFEPPTSGFRPCSTMSGLRANVASLISEAASGTEAERKRACELHMAYSILLQLHVAGGTNFRRRAAELLQLCVLDYILEVVPFFNCKSGIDRTGIAAALWTSVYQIMGPRGTTATATATPSTSSPSSSRGSGGAATPTPANATTNTPLWLLYFLSMNYALVVKTVKGIHQCGVAGRIPMRQLEGGLSDERAMLPFAAGGTADEEELAAYSAVEELVCRINHPTRSGSSHPSLGSVEKVAYNLLRALFFESPAAILPRLQHAFFINVLGTACKVSAASTGVHGLKYGDAALGGYNALAAQFLPTVASSPSTRKSPLYLTENRRGISGTDCVVSKAFCTYLMAAAAARGT